MKDVIGLMGVILIGFFFIQTSATYAQEDLRHNDLVDVMSVVAEETAVESLDMSSKVARGNVYIDEGIYEDNFKKNFNNNVNMALDGYSLGFEYKKDDESVMAIRVTLTDDRGVDYVSTIVSDIRED